MNITDTLKFVSDIEALAKKHNYEVNDFKEWDKEGIIFSFKDKDDEDVSFEYNFNLKTKDIALNIEGSASWEGGYHEYHIAMNVAFFAKLLELTRNIS